MLTEAQPGPLSSGRTKSPTPPAVIKGDDVLTYRDWNERGGPVADSLAALGLVEATGWACGSGSASSGS